MTAVPLYISKLIRCSQQHLNDTLFVPICAKLLVFVTESADLQWLGKHLTTAKYCISALFSASELCKRLKSYSCQKNANNSAKAPVLKG